jgi:uncharacterized protein YcbK (DUF882 family)
MPIRENDCEGSMGDLTKNFDRSEFACKGLNCCDRSAPVLPELVDGLQLLRNIVGLPIRITSGFRCNRHNRIIDGAFESFHTLGMAADIACEGIRPVELAALAERIDCFRLGGIGVYVSWVHVDIRKTGKARWPK